jgi:hypothetical protein
MHFVMMMKKLKEGMDTAQTGEVAKDLQLEGDPLVRMAEGGRGVAQTTAEDVREGAQTMAGEVAGVALIMAQMVVAKVTRGAAPPMTVSAVKLAHVLSAVKLAHVMSAMRPALVASAEKLVLAMTGPPGILCQL